VTHARRPGRRLLLGVAWAVASFTATAAANDDGLHTVYVIRRGWHVDVGVAVEDLHGPLYSVAASFPGARYLVLGFGDRHYLFAKHHHFSDLAGALWPGDGLLLVTGLRATPADAFGAPHVIALRVGREQWLGMDDRASASFADRSDPIDPVAEGPYPGSLFFSTDERYSAAHTCNTWVAEVLSAGGMKMHSRTIIFASQVWHRSKKLAAREQER
jgi:hypothetical protein